jgi:hypothetical protein
MRIAENSEITNEKALHPNQYFNVTFCRGKPGIKSCFFGSAEQTLQSSLFQPLTPADFGSFSSSVLIATLCYGRESITRLATDFPAADCEKDGA